MRIKWTLSLSSLVVVAVAACSQLTMAGGTPLTTIKVADVPYALAVTYAPGDFERVFIATQDGRIKIRKIGGSVTTFLSILSLVNWDPFGETGLLGLAIHPLYADNGYFYVNYINTSGDTVIARYQVSADDPDVADSGSAEILLVVEQTGPYHNGGWLSFGPNDGFLYIALGDGGPAGIGSGAGVNRRGNSLLGKILRIDVDGALPYEIPTDNPCIDVAGVADETWALGVRNPWRNSFDRETGDLYIADVGSSGDEAREEINFQPGDSTGGEHYGWPSEEGFDRRDGSCSSSDRTSPIHSYTHAVEDGYENCAVMGGHVYRGCAIPDLAGAYFFTDHCSGTFWSFRYEGGELLEFTDRTDELAPVEGSLSGVSFGEDAYGEIYIAGGNDVFKIVPDTDGPVNDCNANGFEDGCEILRNPSADSDGNGIPDECEVAGCEGDANGDGTVDPLDAGFVLARLGCPVGTGDADCDSADQNADGLVDPLDGGFVLARFGPCD